MVVPLVFWFLVHVLKSVVDLDDSSKVVQVSADSSQLHVLSVSRYSGFLLPQNILFKLVI